VLVKEDIELIEVVDDSDESDVQIIDPPTNKQRIADDIVPKKQRLGDDDVPWNNFPLLPDFLQDTTTWTWS
jgi:hypothetical protein